MLLGLIERSVAASPGTGRAADAARRARLVPRARGARVTTVRGRPGRAALPRPGARRRRSASRTCSARMTLEEKVAQLGSRWVFELADADGSSRRSERRPAAPRARPGDAHLRREQPAAGARRPSSPTRSSATSSSETRLGIPAIVHEEICSGPDGARRDGLPAGDRPREHVGARRSSRRSRTPSATQMRAGGAHQGLGPVLDVCRDPRWGRTRGDVRRGSVPRRADGRRVRARPAGRRPARRASSRRRSTSSATAPPRAAMNWAPAQHRRRASCATSTSIRSRPRSARPASAR